MNAQEIKPIVEAMLFVSDRPVSAARIRAVLGKEAVGCDIEQIIRDIGEEYTQRKSPLEVRAIAGGWQFATRAEYGAWIRKLYREKTTLKLSASALETLSIIAYKQPITRAEMEQIRGVEVAGVLETMLERKLIKIIGRKETLGRPLLYGTTQEFLRHFGLGHVSELPSIDELVPPSELPQTDESSTDEFAEGGQEAVQQDLVAEIMQEESVKETPGAKEE